MMHGVQRFQPFADDLNKTPTNRHGRHHIREADVKSLGPINLSALFAELARLLGHAGFDRLRLIDALLCRELAHILGNPSRVFASEPRMPNQ